MPNNNLKVDFRKELSGAMYQIKILLLLLWQGLNNKCKFRLRTEVADAEKFDDALFYQRKENGKFGIKFLQIKHARFEEANLVYKDFVDDFESTRCNLRKYFISFRKILQQFKEEELEDFILCTNIPFSSLMLKRKETDNDNQALVFEEQRQPDTLFGSLKHGEWKQYKLVQINDEVKEIFKNSTNLSLLAEEIIDCIFQKDGNEKVELNLRNYWISLYHCALINDGIIEQKDRIKLSWGFIKGNKKNASDFRTRFFDYLNQKTTLTEKELANYTIELRLNEISDNAMKNAKNLDDIDNIKLSIKALIQHVQAEDMMDLEYFFADDDSILHDVMLIWKDDFNQHKDDLNVNVEVFYMELKKQLLITLSKSSWHVSTNLQQIWNAENVNTENNVGEPSTTYQNLAKILIGQKPLSDDAILVNNVPFLKLMLTYEDKTCSSVKLKDEFPTSPHADIVEFRECFINSYAAELFKKRENEVFPKTLANYILDGKNPEIIENYLLKPALFYQFKKVIKCESEWIFNNDLVNGNNLNESRRIFRNALIGNYQNKLMEHLIHHEFVVADGFKDLLLPDKNDKACTYSNESLKSLGMELASCAVNKKNLAKNALFETNKSLLKLIFEDVGEKHVKFCGSFLNISQKQPNNSNSPKYTFRRYFLKSYAIQKLRTIKFSLSENFGKLQVPIQKKHIEKFAAEIIEIFKKTKSVNYNNNILVYDKTKYGKNAAEDVMEDLKGEIFEINRNEMVKFHQRFFDIDESNLSKNATQLKQILKTNLSENDFCNLKNCEIKIINNLPCYETVKEIGDIDDDIKNFLEKLLLVKTPSETLISEVIEKEVSQKFRLLDNDMAADYLFKKVLNWAKEKEERFLDEREARSFLIEIEQKIINSMVTGTNNSYCAKLRSYGISFKKLLKLPLERGQVIKLTTNQTLLTAIKMEQTLRHLYIDKNNYNIISTNAMLPIQNEIIESMKGAIDLLVIVDKTRPNEANTFLSFWENLCYLIKYQPTKKIIIVTENCWKPISKMIDQNLDDNKINFIDLSKKTKRLFKNMPLVLQGKRFCEYRILYKLKKHIDSSVIVDFIMNKEIQIGESLAEFTEDEEKCYIKRKIKLIKVDKEILGTFFIKNIYFVEGVAGTAEKNVYDLMRYFSYDKKKHIFLKKEINKREMSRTNELTSPIIWNEDVNLFNKRTMFGIDNIYSSESESFENDSSNWSVGSFSEKTMSGVDNTDSSESESLENDSCRFMMEEDYLDMLNMQQHSKYMFYGNVPHPDKAFQYLCKKYRNKSVHWLKMNKDQLYLYYSNVPKTVVSHSVALKELSSCEVSMDEDNFLKQIVQDRVVIISDKAGIGKSTILTKVAQNFDEMNLRDLKWKIRINLNLYTKVLSVLNSQKNFTAADLTLNYCVNQTYEEIILRSLNHGTKQNTRKMSFEDHVFEFCFRTGKMLIIFDGFDEINPDYGDYVMQLFLKLKNTTKNQIWIASRTNFEEALEKNLESFAYKLKPFNAEDQKEFLIKFLKSEWKRMYNVPIKNQSRLVKYVDAVLFHFYNTIGTTHVEEIGIPLLTKMLAECFEKNHDEQDKNLQWHGCFDYLSDEKLEIPQFSNKISNLFLLYETFVRQKIINYFLKEKQILDVSKPFNTKLIHTIYSYETKIHQILGIMVMTDTNLESAHYELPTESEKEEINVWISDFRSGTENIGLIDSIAPNGLPSFNHLTYAEYFAACYLKEKLLLTPKDAFEIMNKILEKDVPVFLYCVKHLLFPQENQKSDFDLSALDRKLKGITIINYLASNGFHHCLRHFITFNEFRKNMKQEKTILHYAAESNQVYILLFIFSNIYGIFKELDSAYFLFPFLSLLDNYVKLNEQPLIASIIDELKEFCESSLGHESNQTFNDAMKSIYPGSRSFFSSAYRIFFNMFSYQTIKDILEYKNGEYFGVTISAVEYISSVFENEKLREIEKFDILKYVWSEREDDQKYQRLGEILFENAIKYEQTEMLLKFLMEKSSKSLNTVIFKRCFFLACQLKNAKLAKELLKILIDSKHKIQSEEFRGNNFLHIACIYNAPLQILKYIIEEMGVYINAVNDNNETALLISVKYIASLNMIKYLLSKGADVTVKDKFGKTVLNYGTQENDDEIIKLLLGKCNLLISESCKHTLNKYFNDPKFDVNKRKEGFTRLHHAIIDSDEILSEFLIRKNADINAKDKCGKTPSDYASEKELTRIKDILMKFKEENTGILSNPPDLCAETVEKLKYFFDIVITNKPNNYSFLKSFDEMYYSDDAGKTLFHHAASVHNVAFMKKALILNKFTKCIDAKDKSGKTPLAYAMESNDFEIFKLLLYYGASFDNQSYKYQNPQTNISKILNKLKSLFEHLYNEELDEFKQKLEDETYCKVDSSILLNVRDHKGNTLSEYILRTNNFGLVKYCLMKGGVIRYDSKSEDSLFSIPIGGVVILPSSKFPNGNVYKLASFLFKCFEALKKSRYSTQSIINHIEKHGFTEMFLKVRWFFDQYNSVTFLKVAEERNEQEMITWLKDKGAKTLFS